MPFLAEIPAAAKAVQRLWMSNRQSSWHWNTFSTLQTVAFWENPNKWTLFHGLQEISAGLGSQKSWWELLIVCAQAKRASCPKSKKHCSLPAIWSKFVTTALSIIFEVCCLPHFRMFCDISTGKSRHFTSVEFPRILFDQPDFTSHFTILWFMELVTGHPVWPCVQKTSKLDGIVYSPSRLNFTIRLLPKSWYALRLTVVSGEFPLNWVAFFLLSAGLQTRLQTVPPSPKNMQVD